MPLERDTTILPAHRRRDPAVHTVTTTRSRAGRIAVGLIAAVLLLGACGGDDGDAGSDAAGSGAADGAVASGGTDDASSDDGSDSIAEGVAPAPEGPSGGLQLDEAWPEQVWIPADVTVTGGTFGIADDGTYQANLLSVTEADLDDLRDALVRGNGTPDSQGDHASGSYNMNYHDLLAGHDVGFRLIPDAPGTGLVVTIFPS